MKNMKCEYCDNEIPHGVSRCPSCGASVRVIEESAISSSLQPTRQAYTESHHSQAGEQKNRVVYVILGIFLGVLGIHNFYAGRTYCGLAQLLTTLLLGWLILPVFGIWIWTIVEICTIKCDGDGLMFS